MSSIGIFPGRFQPFSIKHAERVLSILKDYPSLNLIVAVANWKGIRTKENFLTGAEAASIAKLSLKYRGLKNVKVVKAHIKTSSSLKSVLVDLINRYQVKILFSGSKRTLAAAKLIKNLKIVPLIDPEIPPRSTHIRESIIKGDNLWKKWVSPNVISYLDNLKFRKRLEFLPAGEKRPWRVA